MFVFLIISKYLLEARKYSAFSSLCHHGSFIVYVKFPRKLSYLLSTSQIVQSVLFVAFLIFSFCLPSILIKLSIHNFHRILATITAQRFIISTLTFNASTGSKYFLLSNRFDYYQITWISSPLFQYNQCNYSLSRIQISHCNGRSYSIKMSF